MMRFFRKIQLLACLLIFVFLLGNISAEESTCIACHTDAKKLIQITREIEAGKEKFVVTESTGEG